MASFDEALLTEPWGKHPNWSPQGLQDLIDSIQYVFPAYEEEPCFNILLIGPVGVGKTSVANTCQSALRGQILDIGRTAASDRSLTIKFTRHCLKAKQETKVNIYDTRGFEEKSEERGVFGPCLNDIKLILEGSIKEGYVFEKDGIPFNSEFYQEGAEGKIHLVVIVMDAFNFTLSDQVNTLTRAFCDVIQAAAKKDIRCCVLLTKIDSSKTIADNLQKAFYVEHLWDVRHDIAIKLAITENDVLVVQNYSTELEPSVDIDCLALHTLHQMLRLAKLTLEAQKKIPIKSAEFTPWTENINTSQRGYNEKINKLQDLRKLATIVVLGFQASGKTQYINSTLAILSKRMHHKYPAQKTLKLNVEQLKFEGKQMNIQFLDTMGLSCEDSLGIKMEDVKQVLKGNFAKDTVFNPLVAQNGKTKHYNVNAAVIMVDGNEFLKYTEQQMKSLKELVKAVKTEEKRACVVLVSHIDELCPEVKRDPSTIYTSDAVQRCLHTISETLQVAAVDVLPVINYNISARSLDVVTSSILLHALLHVCETALYLTEEEEVQEADVAKEQPTKSKGWFW